MDTDCWSAECRCVYSLVSSVLFSSLSLSLSLNLNSCSDSNHKNPLAATTAVNTSWQPFLDGCVWCIRFSKEDLWQPTVKSDTCMQKLRVGYSQRAWLVAPPASDCKSKSRILYEAIRWRHLAENKSPTYRKLVFCRSTNWNKDLWSSIRSDIVDISRTVLIINPPRRVIREFSSSSSTVLMIIIDKRMHRHARSRLS